MQSIEKVSQTGQGMSLSIAQVVEKILQKKNSPNAHPSDWNTYISREQVN